MLNVKIGKLLFCLDIKEEYIIGDRINKFICNDNEYDLIINVKINHVEAFNSLNCKFVNQIDDRLLIMKDETDTLEYRLYYHPIKKIPYVLYREVGFNCIELDILKEVCPVIIIDTEFFEHVALEKYLLEVNSFILHSSSIQVENEVVLFSAPSGTGKSTQANLWNKYRNTTILNGDRNIIEVNEEGVYVHGLPFCGTSNIYSNISLPLKSIVILSQSNEDKINDLSLYEKFLKIYSETTINNWNEEYVRKVIDLCNQLVKRTKICSLSCTMNQTAVKCLEKYLED